MSGASGAAAPAVRAGVVVVAAWSVLWWAPWQPWLAGWPAVRAVAGLLLWLLPGICLQRALGGGPSSVARELLVGLLVAVALTGGLGLIASLVQAPIGFVTAALWLIGAVGLLAAARRGWRPPRWPDRGAVLWSVPACAAAFVAARMAAAPEGSSDNFTYVALIAEHGSGWPLGFGDPIFGRELLAPSRVWLAFWPLSLAVIGRLAGMDGLELTAVYAGPLLAVLAAAVWGWLARALGCGRRLAALAVVVQVTCLLLLTDPVQPGGVFFGRLREDKAVAAFLLAPLWFGVIEAFLRAPTRRAAVLVACGGFALLVTHPTMLALASLVALGRAGLAAATSRRWRPAALVAAVAVVLPLVPFAFRFVDQPYTRGLAFTVAAAEGAGPLLRARARRLERLPDGWYRAAPAILTGWPRALAAVAALAALAAVHRLAAARYVLAASVVVGSVFVPVAAWVLGLAITPFHLWRAAWFTPFGIGAALLAGLAARARPVRGRRRFATVALLGLEAALLGVGVRHALGAAHAWRAPRPALENDWRTRVAIPHHRPPCAVRYDELRAFGARLERVMGGEAWVMGDASINDFLPGAAAGAKMVAFRERAYMIGAGVAPEETARRWALWKTVVSGDADPAERLRAADAAGVEYLVVCGDGAAVEALRRAAPERIVPVARVGALAAYRLRPARREDPGG